jgi:DNA-binding transcriptional ArsR family regulator
MAAAIHLIQSSRTAATLFHPERLRLLELLGEPHSAAGLARRLNLPRQKVNYHLRELENEGLVELVEERRKGNCVERVVRATARAYVVSPAVLGKLAADPSRAADRFSASYLVAVSAKAIRELAVLGAGARKANKRLATLTVQSQVRFSSAAARNAFAEELATTVARLVTKYHEAGGEGRSFELFAGLYPAVGKSEAPGTESLLME